MARSPYTLETAREILLGKRSPAVKVLDSPGLARRLIPELAVSLARRRARPEPDL